MPTRTRMPMVNELAVQRANDQSAVDVLARGISGEVAALTYTGPESIKDAKMLREKAMAMVELGRRAGVLGIDHLLAARGAERGLGQMLDLGRRAGDIASNGGDRISIDTGESGATLPELGIKPDLAADAAMLARLDDVEWEGLCERAREAENASRSAIVQGAKQLVAFREGRDMARTEAQATAEKLAAAEKEAHRAAQEAGESLARLMAAPYKPLYPTLTPEELNVEGLAERVAQVAQASQPAQAQPMDMSIEAARYRATVNVITELCDRLGSTPPVLTADAYTAVNVLTARQAVAKLQDALSVWMRDLNGQWGAGR